MFEGQAQLAPTLAALMLVPEFFGPLRKLGSDRHAALDAEPVAARLETLLAVQVAPSGEVPPPAQVPRLTLTPKRDGLSFAATSLTILFSTVTIFMSLFPNVLPSTLSEGNNLTIIGSAAQAYNLHLLSWTGVIFLPLVIGYQVWNYYVFRQRVQEEGGGLEHGY